MEFSRQHAGEKINETSYHVQRTLNDNYAYIGNMASLTPTIEQNCELMILEETFLPLQYAIALQKGSPLTDTVSRWSVSPVLMNQSLSLSLSLSI